ncbi:MAG: beta-propeller fold lactonase family protein [Clostridiaceae bacterium]|nr:beta-propeller fold lactonase family protein [Clostridiaceae bacterium]
MSKTFAYIGNWSNPRTGGTGGITVTEYDEEKGTFSLLCRCFPEINCGAACLDQEKGIIYYVNEQTEVYGQNLGGQVFALKINPETGMLTEINHKPSYGLLPSYCAVDPSHQYLIVVNHSGRNVITKTIRDDEGEIKLIQEHDEAVVVLFPLGADGSIGMPCDIVRHTGHGALPNQDSPHIHSVMVSPCGSFFAVCDKGNDTLYFYRINREMGTIDLCDKLSAIPGSSPRYSAFHPTEPYLYFNNETKSIVSMVRFDQEGKLEHVCSVSCMEDNSLDEKGMQSDIRIHPSGKYLYDLIRDNSTIAVFVIDQDTKIPIRTQIVPAGSNGSGRGLAISPDGRYLHAAACPEDGIYTYKIGVDGYLKAMPTEFKDAAPGNITFYRSLE